MRDEIAKLAYGALLVLFLLKKKKKDEKNSYIGQRRKKSTKRKIWVRTAFQRRNVDSFYHSLINEIRLSDAAHFKNFLRMSPAKYEELFNLVAPVLTKSSALRDPISVGERLCITLRFLASGDSLTSISYLFRTGKSTCSNIISETLQTIWDKLSVQVFPPLDEHTWIEISEGFKEKWHFPKCIGAIDGKHVVIEAPPNSGTNFRNYKHSFSIVLLAVCDAKCRFIFCDIGAFGKQSDGGIFRASSLGRMIMEKGIKHPSPTTYGSRDFAFPYVLIGDEAFPLSQHLMRPYSARQSLTTSQKVFNVRLSHARQVIERAFGILSNRFRIFRKPIQLKVENIERVVQATICLHNWLLEDDFNVEFLHDEQPISSFRDMLGGHHNSPLSGACEVRNTFADYFLNEGALPFQWKNV